MLVLSRKSGQRLHIGDDVILTVTRCSNGRVRLGIDAPSHVRVMREEVLSRITSEEDEQVDRAVSAGSCASSWVAAESV